MSIEHLPLVSITRRGLRRQLIVMPLWLALAVLTAGPARNSRPQAGLLLLIGLGFLLDARGLRANGAVLAAAGAPQPSWIPWLSGLVFALGAVLCLAGLVFLWHPDTAP